MFSVDAIFLTFTWVILAGVLASFIVFAFMAVFAYSPVEAQWNVSMRSTSSHIHSRTFGIILTAISGVLDIGNLFLALQRTWKLQMDKELKLLVSIVFFLGILYAQIVPSRVRELSEAKANFHVLVALLPQYLFGWPTMSMGLTGKLVSEVEGASHSLAASASDYRYLLTQIQMTLHFLARPGQVSK